LCNHLKKYPVPVSMQGTDIVVKDVYGETFFLRTPRYYFTTK